MVQRKNNNASRNKKKKNKQENNSKLKQTTNFKKKKNKEGGCFVCGSDEHRASGCLDRKYKQEKKSANMVVSEAEGGTSGYGNSLPTILSVCHSPEWWMDTGPIFMCVLILICFQALLMGNGSHVRVLGVGTVILKLCRIPQEGVP